MQPYRPLPKGLKILPSPIEGYGLFTEVEIPENTVLGISHIPTSDIENFHCGLIRTPLSGHLNHNENNNCRIEELTPYHYLVTAKFIAVGSELTLNYKDNTCGKEYVGKITS